MSDLAAFVLARLAEDEEMAQLCAAMFPPPWDVSDRGWRVRIYAGDVPAEDFSSDDPEAMTTRNPVVMEVEPDRNIEDPHWLSERVEHVCRHDPARVLAQVEAMRRVVELHAPFPCSNVRCPVGLHCFTCDEGLAADAETGGVAHHPCPTLRALASIWAAHEDYDEEWAL